MTFKEWCKKRNELMVKFKRIFKFDCPMDESKLFIDIFKLEEYVDGEDDESLSEAIIKKYGKEADEVVDELIEMIDEIPLAPTEYEAKGLLKIARALNGTTK